MERREGGREGQAGPKKSKGQQESDDMGRGRRREREGGEEIQSEGESGRLAVSSRDKEELCRREEGSRKGQGRVVRQGRGKGRRKVAGRSRAETGR